MAVDLSARKTSGALSTNATSRKRPIHRWFNFIAGFSPEFVDSCIDEAEASSDGYLLDPFAGAGTALLAAQLKGLDSVGYEPQPFFAEMARAKLDGGLTARAVESSRDLVRECLECPLPAKEVWSGKPLEFLQKLVPGERLERLAGCPAAVAGLPDRDRPIFHLLVSRVLEAASGSATDGIYKAPTSTKRGTDVFEALESISATIVDDLRATPARTATATLYERSSATTMPAGASICVTSPPYFNNFDFAEMTRMELYFWGWAASWREITQTVRAKLLPNTTTVPKEAKYGPDDSDLPSGRLLDAVAGLHAELSVACAGRSKDYHRLAFPYFEGLHRVFSEASEALNAGAPIHVVVADSAFYGVHVPLHEMVAASLNDLGFGEPRITHLRDRGDRWVLDKRQGPAGKLGEYWVSAIR
jgi:hypothetical protein